MSSDGDQNGPDKAAMNKRTTPVYYPSLYRYTCVGHVRASADDPSQKVCHGIPLRLQQLVESNRTATRAQATQEFTSLHAVDNYDSKMGIPSSLHDMLQTQAIVFDEQQQEQGDGKHKQNSKDFNEIDCYGVTDVEILVLRDPKSNKNTVTGVASRCIVGQSVRDTGSKEGSVMSTTLHLGFLEFAMSAVQVQHQEKQRSQAATERLPKEPTPKQKDQNSEGEPRPLLHPETATRMLAFSQKVANNMVKGGTILRDAVSEDFPSRMMTASHQIVGHMGKVAGYMGKTADQTAKMPGIIYRYWRGDDDDSSNRDH